MGSADDLQAGAHLLSAGEPGFRAPMLATLVGVPPRGPGWWYEPKLDGYRLVAARHGPRVTLWTRNRLDRTASFPEVAEALAGQPTDRFVVDGEVVAYEGERTSFGLLQRRAGISDPRAARSSGIPVVFHVFDLLHLGGVDLERLPLWRRRRLLDGAFELAPPLRATEVLEGDGAALLARVCDAGWEGLIGKRVDTPYHRGRSRDWVKLKCVLGQELVIGGWTEPKGARTGFGSLLVGYHDPGGRLVFAGRVGTGFDEATLAGLTAALHRLERPTSPFEVGSPTGRGLHWAEPRLVAQVGFSEWTGSGKVRHPRFLGLRHDKAPAEVVREEAAPG
jgi:DNA ligase D-like protein (predicted ligase)